MVNLNYALKRRETMQEVYQNVYLINLPLPQNPLRSLTSYLVKGKGRDRNLLIDTGFNHPETESALMNALKELNVRLEKTDLLITHSHSDHSGLAGKLKNEYNTVYSSSRECVLLRDYAGEHYWKELVKNQRLMGFPYDFLHTDHPGYCNKNEIQYDRESKDPGDALTVGEYEFEVIDFSGHTPGQIGLYEKKHKLLFSGDHLLSKITPTLEFWNLDYNSLGTYLNNLKKMNDFDVDYLFTAHREFIPNMRERVGQMLEHHDARLNRSLEIISEKPSNVWTVASGITWSYLGGNFTKFPPPQQWFAANETLTHLEHLFHTRTDIKRQFFGGALFYGIK